MIMIVDYGMGNVRSVAKAFELLGNNVVISSNPEDLIKADKIVLPGVGAFGEGMKNLNKLSLKEVLTQQVFEKKKPFLGICLGMQLIAKESEEFGLHKGLGWINAKVKAFDVVDKKLKVPHVGWNNISLKKDNSLFKGIKEGAEFYFVHSFHMVCEDKNNIIATCDYGGEITAAVQHENIFATQFHPEKSQVKGLKIIKNFVEDNND